MDWWPAFVLTSDPTHLLTATVTTPDMAAWCRPPSVTPPSIVLTRVLILLSTLRPAASAMHSMYCTTVTYFMYTSLVAYCLSVLVIDYACTFSPFVCIFVYNLVVPQSLILLCYSVVTLLRCYFLVHDDVYLRYGTQCSFSAMLFSSS